MQTSTLNALDTAATVKRISLVGGGAVVVRGEPGAPPILFLHGVAGAAWSWAPQAETLAQTRRTYAWEARGHGDTARVSDAGMSEYYEDARQALELVVQREGRSAIVAGHSLGGLLALALAASHPGDVAALCLVEPMYLSSSSPLGPLAVFGPFMLPFVIALAEGFRYDALAARAYARAIFALSFFDHAAMERAWVHQRRQKPIEYRQFMLELAGASTRFPLRQFAKEIALPVHLIERACFASEMHFPSLIQQLRTRGSGFTRRVICGGHYLQLDREQAVTAELGKFVATIDRAAADISETATAQPKT